MQTPDSSRLEGISLYELFGRLLRVAGDERRATVDAILRHPEWDLVLRAACGSVLARLAVHSDTPDDLLQETICLLMLALVDAKLAYQDWGAAQFRGWLHRVAVTAAERALAKCRPLSLEDCTLADFETLDAMAVAEEVAIGFDDVLVAISRIPNLLTRQVLQDWFVARLSLSQSAELRGISIAETWRIRQRGREQLKTVLLRDWFGAEVD